MKKFLAFSLVCSLGLNLYLFNSEYILRDDFEADLEEFEYESAVINDSVQLAQSGIQKQTADCEPKAKIIRKKKIIKTQMKEEPNHGDEEISHEEVRASLEESYQKWIDKSENFFIEDLQLNAEQIAEYRKLSAQRQNEISSYFDKKTKGGTDDSPSAYIFTTDDTIFMGRIAEKYERLLKASFGEENYLKHKNFIKNHNNSSMTDEFGQVVEF